MELKYIPFTVFLYFKEGVQTVVFVNGRYHGYHNGKTINSKRYNNYTVVDTTHKLFDEFKLIVDNHPDLTWQSLLKYTELSLTDLPQDILRSIGRLLVEKKDYHSLILTSKIMSEILKKDIKDIEEKKKLWDNQLEDIFFAFPDKPWDYKLLSNNPRTTVAMIRKKINENWNWSMLSYSPDKYLDLIREYPNKKWAWEMISKYISLTDQLFKEFYNKWNWHYLSTNKSLKFNLVKKYLNENWDWEELSSNPTVGVQDLEENYPWEKDVIFNPNITSAYIRKHNLWDYNSLSYSISLKEIDDNPNESWNWRIISSRNDPHINYLIEKYPDKDWSWTRLSGNSYLEVSTVMKLPGKEWDFYLLSDNKRITGKLIEMFIDRDWDWYKLSKNIGIDIIEENPSWKWKWKSDIWENPNLNIDFILKYKDKVHWTYLSLNPCITMKIIEDHPEFPWNWEYISINPNLNLKFLLNHQDKPWNWYHIQKNRFT